MKYVTQVVESTWDFSIVRHIFWCCTELGVCFDYFLYGV